MSSTRKGVPLGARCQHRVPLGRHHTDTPTHPVKVPGKSTVSVAILLLTHASVEGRGGNGEGVREGSRKNRKRRGEKGDFVFFGEK